MHVSLFTLEKSFIDVPQVDIEKIHSSKDGLMVGLIYKYNTTVYSTTNRLLIRRIKENKYD